MFLLTACSAPALSADFNENEVKLLSQDVVSLLNAQDSKGLRAIFTEQMNTAITDDVFVQIYAAIEGGGKFEAIEDITVVGSTDKSTGEEFATAVVTAKYENQTFTSPSPSTSKCNWQVCITDKSGKVSPASKTQTTNLSKRVL
jgi:predicted methyltransferase